MEASAQVKEWLSTNETAHSFFTRAATERPPLLIPPLHRLPLRSGNVVEVAGPSPSAKSHILLQVVVNCILPKEWNGVCYGGLEQSVMFIDLDCRFDVSRLVQLLKFRISNSTCLDVEVKPELKDIRDVTYGDELVSKCLERFLYVRCYDSLEFLATLKTLAHQLNTRRQGLVSRVCFMMIDSIGAYYWVDRASTSLPLGSNNRKTLSLQSITEAIVHEIQNTIQIHPMLILATKATIYADKSITSDIQRRKWSTQDVTDQSTMEKVPENIFHREYMASAWQSFVTHRIFVRPSVNATNEQVYLAQWLKPSLGFTDKFVVRDAGILIVS